ncbi:MAG: Ig-like domain-containing protein, partial [Oscillospiraceae bacterium]|nr:Ig-like domain-containing protein [Oscillospiraceae bacterium]
WYIADAVALKAPAGYDIYDVVKDGAAAVSVGAATWNLPDNRLATQATGRAVLTYRLRSTAADDTLGAILAAQSITLWRDSAINTALTAADYAVSTRGFSLTNRAGESLYIHAGFDGTGAAFVDDDYTIGARNNAISRGVGDSWSYALGAGDPGVIAVSFSAPNTGTKVAYSTFNTTDTVTVTARDEAGNQQKLLNSATVPLYTARELATATNMNQDTGGNYALSQSGARTVTITGEPGEVVRVVQTDAALTVSTYYIQLDAGGRAIITIAPVSDTDMAASVNGGVDEAITGVVWIEADTSLHTRQTLVFSYADTAHVTTATGNPGRTFPFAYYGPIAPVSTDPGFLDRQSTLSITLPGEVKQVEIKAGPLTLLKTTSPADVSAGAHTYTLSWPQGVPNLPVPGIENLRITLTGLDDVAVSSDFNIGKSQVPVPIELRLTPEPTEDDFVGNAAGGRLKVAITATEYEPLLVSVNGGEPVALKASGAGSYDEEGTGKGFALITVPMQSLPEDQISTITVSYRDVIGPEGAASFVFDARAKPVIVTTSLYEGGKYLAGIVEPKSQVYVAMPGGNTVRATVDAVGYFIAELPPLKAGEYVTIAAYDRAGNLAERTELVQAQPGTQKVHPVGKLHPYYAPDGSVDWAQAASVTAAQLRQGVTLPLAAGNTFACGSLTLRMGEDGGITYSYTLDNGLTELGRYFAARTGQVTGGSLLLKDKLSLEPDAAFTPDGGARSYWIYAEFLADLPAAAMQSSFQTFPCDARTAYLQANGIY